VRVAPPVSSPDTSQRVSREDEFGLSGDSSSGRRRSFNSASKTSDICLASSRVGAIIMARVPIDRSIYESVLNGSRSWMIGRRNDSVFPEPVWDWMNKSLDAVSSAFERATGRVALWIDVGLETFILEDRCAIISGSRPRLEKAEESVSGALLGFDAILETGFGAGASIFGLYENREDIIWVGGRVVCDGR
jgi:hypothetical protein